MQLNKFLYYIKVKGISSAAISLNTTRQTLNNYLIGSTQPKRRKMDDMSKRSNGFFSPDDINDLLTAIKNGQGCKYGIE